MYHTFNLPFESKLFSQVLIFLQGNRRVQLSHRFLFETMSLHKGRLFLNEHYQTHYVIHVGTIHIHHEGH